MKEFNLNSAEKYKDGSPMMSDLPVQLIRLLKRIELLEKKVRDDERKLANITVALKYSDLDSFKVTFEHTGKDFCGNCKHFDMEGETPVCTLRKEVLGFYAEPDDASCSHYEDNFGTKPDREECQHCPKSQCDNCMNFPF